MRPRPEGADAPSRGSPGLETGRSRGAIAALTLALSVAACGDRDGARVTLEVQVPEDAPTVYLAGSLEALGPWDPDGLALEGDGELRRGVLTVPRGDTFEYKFTLGSWDREGLGPTGTVMGNFRLVAQGDTTVRQEIMDFKKDPRAYLNDVEGSGVLGDLVYWRDVPSEFLAEPRHVGIWLPPGYEDDSDRRYPVIYMADGQNLFDPRIANTGTDWGVDEAMVRNVDAGLHGPAIVVGVWNSSLRIQEYSPWHGAPAYADFLVRELMPRIDEEFRTLTDRDSTFHMGSSMGGLLSWYLVKEHPDHFSACGCLSTHFPHSERGVTAFLGDGGGGDPTPYVIADIRDGAAVPEETRYFFDYGTEGLDATYAPVHREVRAWLLDQGLVEGEDFVVRAYPGADHNEASWRARVGDQLAWLLAGRVPE